MNKNLNKEINWLLKEKYDGQLNALAQKDIERLKAGQPIDYVIGFTRFFGCKIDLSKKPLIPRSETEFWVDYIVRQINKENRPLKILDVFSGSGCIGIALLKNTKTTKLILAEKNKNSINQIKINCKINKIAKQRYKIIRSDILKNVKGNFDLILANPPYIPTKNKNKIQKSVLKYEPKQALFGGGDGLFYIKKFLKQAKNHLSKNGSIYMEFDPPQKKQIEIILKENRYKSWQFNKDQYNKYRWVEIQ